MVVAFAAGGGTDTAARLIAKELAVRLGQPIVIENRAGAGGAIGAASVIRAAPDGYTILFGTGSELDVLPSVKTNPPYDALKDLQPISRVGTVSFVLVAHPSVPANNVKDLIALARAKPGEISYASFGIGATNHLIGESFSSKTGVRLLHVPYRGSAVAASDLLSGQVKIAFDTVSVMMPYVNSGKLKALATLSPVRSDLAPDLPTMAESGVEGLMIEGWLGMLAPRETSPAIIDRLHSALASVLKSPAMIKTLKERGVRVVADQPAEFAAFMKTDIDKWKEVARTSGIQVE
jgi:tripartite-type tricarboxylate transporter receptor subunit TctC